MMKISMTMNSMNLMMILKMKNKMKMKTKMKIKMKLKLLQQSTSSKILINLRASTKMQVNLNMEENQISNKEEDLTNLKENKTSNREESPISTKVEISLGIMATIKIKEVSLGTIKIREETSHGTTKTREEISHLTKEARISRNTDSLSLSLYFEYYLMIIVTDLSFKPYMYQESWHDLSHKARGSVARLALIHSLLIFAPSYFKTYLIGENHLWLVC